MLKMEKKNHYCIILQYYIFNYREEAAAGKTNQTGFFDWSVNMKL